MPLVSWFQAVSLLFLNIWVYLHIDNKDASHIGLTIYLLYYWHIEPQECLYMYICTSSNMNTFDIGFTPNLPYFWDRVHKNSIGILARAWWDLVMSCSLKSHFYAFEMPLKVVFGFKSNACQIITTNLLADMRHVCYICLCEMSFHFMMTSRDDCWTSFFSAPCTSNCTTRLLRTFFFSGVKINTSHHTPSSLLSWLLSSLIFFLLYS